MLKKAASDVEDHVFRFALYECVAKIWKSLVFNGGHITNYVTCLNGCFGDVKVEGASLLTPSFIIFSPFYKLNEKKEDSEG